MSKPSGFLEALENFESLCIDWGAELGSASEEDVDEARAAVLKAYADDLEADSVARAFYRMQVVRDV